MPFAQQFDLQVVFWIVVAVQVAGLLSAWLARRSAGGPGQRPCQWLFLSCLTLVGLTSVVSMGISATSWLFSAATLALMIIGAVWDVGTESKAETA